MGKQSINGCWLFELSILSFTLPFKCTIFTDLQQLINMFLVGGWPTPLKNMKFSWDDDIPYIYIIYIYGKIKNVPNHQPAIIVDLPLENCDFP